MSKEILNDAAPAKNISRKKALLLGNEAIAQAVVAAGCQVTAAYPGTPSSEILPAIAACADRLAAPTVVEWGANEKVAFEMALAAAFTGARSCAVMKQVGLNVAADPFMTGALFQLKGGMLLISADDPGPHSSQNEQDSRFFAMFAKVPCLDPSDALEASVMVKAAYGLSEKHGVIVMLRPTTRVAHCRQAIEEAESFEPGTTVKFERDPSRWTQLPALVRTAHPRHNARIAKIREEFETDWGAFNCELPAKGKAKLGVIAGGVAFSMLRDLLAEWGREDISILKIGTPYPLPNRLVEGFIARHEKILVLEETYPVIETQLLDRTKVNGRWNDVVPSAGELLPDVIEKIVLSQLGETVSKPDSSQLSAAVEELGLAPRKPQLCAGCPHRSSFFAIRKAIPGAINPSDIGCYTLGINQKGLDTSVCMGGSVTTSSGLYMAHKATGQERPIVATIGDSTFFHMGVPGLISAVYNKHAFVLCILDNSITAMTGGQSHPGIGNKPRAKDRGVALDIETTVRGCGVTWVETVEAYDIEAGVNVVKRAWEHAKNNEAPAVVIYRHPCMLLRVPQESVPVTVKEDKCIGCRYCIDFFGCPGLSFDAKAKKTSIDARYCVSCGVCRDVCPHGAITEQE
ncbi:MAG: indolepyruvate ferredoxin oxidoreductase subunit alpha [Synergistaceae bacterium]|jgi:indolepyruvate ferredoxin oxidoreductase alpha subunit|nr:indolepyruvate ferredoxin oxidoreductase subunit alpha [Synergistaceae bacterium]